LSNTDWVLNSALLLNHELGSVTKWFCECIEDTSENYMKAFFGFVVRWAIPALWLLAVARAVMGGFERGFEPVENAAKPFVYPWTGVLLVCLWMALESAILYIILQPQKFTWSLPRITSALVIFIILSYVHSFIMATDQAGYFYVPAAFTFVITAFLLVLFLIGVARALIQRVIDLRSKREKAA